MKQSFNNFDDECQQIRPPYVLVVDDNMDLADTMSMLLENIGCRVETVYHPSEALLISEKASFDFFVLDIGLPDMNGYELVEVLRKREKNQKATFLAFSAYGDRAYREKSLASGFKYHFVKPSDVGKVVEEIMKSPKFSSMN